MPNEFQSYIQKVQASSSYTEFLSLIDKEVTEEMQIYIGIKNAIDSASAVNTRIAMPEPKKK